MKFMLPLLIAAPAVMGRACKARTRSSTTAVISAPAQTEVAGVSSAAAVESTTAVVVVPQVSSSASLILSSIVPVVSSASPVAVASSSEAAVVVVSSSVPEVAVSSSAAAVKTTLSTAAAAATTSASSSSGTDSSSSSSSSGVVVLDSTAYTGSSTFYGGNLNGGACSFTTYTLPSSIYGTAFSGAVWDNAAECGACVQVTGPSGTIVAMVVDECPECDEGHLDLFPDAFTAVGGTDGVVSTSYKFVSCGISSPIVLHNKSGTSQYWFSMQVVNSNVPVKSLEVSTDGGNTWTATTRQTYNFFENSSGFGTDTVDVRVTATTGETITVSNVGVTSDAQYTAASNFAS